MNASVTNFEWISLAVLALYGWIFPRTGDALFRWIENRFRAIADRRRLAVAVSGMAPVLLRLALLPVLPVPTPAIHDEFSYLLAADTFAHGRLTNPPHPMWRSFETFHVNFHPTYASMFPPAQGLVLALGQWIWHPWLGVLLSTGCMCGAICWMLQGWLPPQWALLGGLLAAIRFGSFSYWMNSYWGGSVAAIGGALAIGALPRIRKDPRPRHAIVLGAGLVILANSRPLEGLIFSIPIAVVFALWLARKGPVSFPFKLRNVCFPLLLILVLSGTWMAYYNWRVTANPLLLPHVLNQKTYHTEPLFLWQTAKPARTYNNAQFNFFYNVWSRSQYRRSWNGVKQVTLIKFQHFWATFLGPVCILPAFMLPWVLRDRKIRLLAITFGVSWLGLIAVIWGLAHYAAPLTGITFALIVQGMRHLRQVRFEGRPVGLAWLRVSVLMALVTFGASLSREIQHPYSWIFDFGPGNLQRASILNTLRREPGKHLVIVRYGNHHYIHNEWVYNDADIDSAKVVWARELDNAQDDKLLHYFHDRHVWLVEPDKAPVELKPYTSPATAMAARNP